VIYMVTGTPGSGKTYYALRSIAEAADGGMPVATNVELADDFGRRVARHHPVRWMIPGRRGAVEKRINARVLVTDSLDELMRVRVPGSREERWLVVLDEAHGWLNARNWNAGDREKIIKWLSQHRKLGAKVLLISQDAENIDAQVRRLVEVEIRLRNLKNARVMGIPVSLGRNLMLAIWTWAGGQKMILRRQVMRLDWRRRLYNTHALPLALDGDDADTIWLPADGAPNAAAAAAPSATAAGAPDVARVPVDPDGVTVAGIDVGPALVPVSVPAHLALGAELARAADPTTPLTSPQTPPPSRPIAPPPPVLPGPTAPPSMRAVSAPSDPSGTLPRVLPGRETTERPALAPLSVPGNRADGPPQRSTVTEA
jgi:adenosyl cobinamide kinase/adenosyl cobinamide phosphate guanylyltransferase